MIILPAIDILGGKPVRLKKGDYGKASQVASSVLETAKAFEQDGASFLHMVDLDGAKAGHPVNHELVLQTIEALDIPVEIGGGIRNAEQARMYLDGGAARVILSTAALEQPQLIGALAKEYPGKIAAGLDCENGRVKVNGWLEDGGTSIEEAITAMEQIGIDTIIVTDISKDGMLEGPSFELYEKLAPQTKCKIIASGGISKLDDLIWLAKSKTAAGAICGKAIYSGNVDLKEAIQALKQLDNASQAEESIQNKAAVPFDSKGEGTC